MPHILSSVYSFKALPSDEKLSDSVPSTPSPDSYTVGIGINKLKELTRVSELCICSFRFFQPKKSPWVSWNRSIIINRGVDVI
jgi:hypothetical protein